MFDANLIDQSSHSDFPIGGLLVGIPTLPRVGEQLHVNGVRFRVEAIAHSITTNSMRSYKALIYLWPLDKGCTP